MISGTAESNSRVKIKDDNEKVIGSTDADSNGNYTVTLSELLHNAETVTVTAMDSAGNVSVGTIVTAPNKPEAFIFRVTPDPVRGAALRFGGVATAGHSASDWLLTDEAGNTYNHFGGFTITEPTTLMLISAHIDRYQLQSTDYATNATLIDVIEWHPSASNQSFGLQQMQLNVPDYLPSHITSMSRMFFDTKNFNQPCANWDVSHVLIMDGAFGNTQYNQDLSEWCVPNITSSPPDFAYANSTGNWPISNRPQWGTCPRGEDQIQ